MLPLRHNPTSRVSLEMQPRKGSLFLTFQTCTPDSRGSRCKARHSPRKVNAISVGAAVNSCKAEPGLHRVRLGPGPRRNFYRRFKPTHHPEQGLPVELPRLPIARKKQKHLKNGNMMSKPPQRESIGQPVVSLRFKGWLVGVSLVRRRETKQKRNCQGTPTVTHAHLETKPFEMVTLKNELLFFWFAWNIQKWLPTCQLSPLRCLAVWPFGCGSPFWSRCITNFSYELDFDPWPFAVLRSGSMQ